MNVAKTKALDQLRGYCATDLCFVFAHAKSKFSHDMSQNDIIILESE